MTLVIARGRKRSKTTQLIELCAEAEAKGEISYIICHNHQEAYRIAQKALEMNLIISFPITYFEFTKHQYEGRTIKNFFFDNVDMFLQSLTTVHIAAMAINTDDRTLVQ
jgi:hypothetical protein